MNIHKLKILNGECSSLSEKVFSLVGLLLRKPNEWKEYT